MFLAGVLVGLVSAAIAIGAAGAWLFHVAYKNFPKNWP